MQNKFSPFLLIRKGLKLYRKATIFFIFLVFFAPQFSSASSPYISKVNVKKENGTFFLSATLTGGFTSEIKEMIQSGAPTTFSYHIKLIRRRTGWFDKTVGEMMVKRNVKYDLLKKVYKVSEEIERNYRPTEEKNKKKGPNPHNEASQGEINGGNGKTLNNFAQVRRWMTDLNEIEIVANDKISEGKIYYVQIHADLKTINLWFPFNYILFFVSFWDVDTEKEASTPFQKTVESPEKI